MRHARRVDQHSDQRRRLRCAALLAVLPQPGPSVEIDPTRLLDTLTGIEPAHLEPVHP